ncbi:MAG: preprotein translocase subunit SecY [Smithellaceae bacterium]|nr:preprotein translocase subunit SecY [Smithellaceae bacterium]
MLDGFKNISKIPELQKRILFTIVILIVYRIGAHVPTPGIDTGALAAFFEQAKGSLLGFFDMFAGGALSNLSIFALGIMPYISASIILQLLTVSVPYLERLSKEGEAGRRKITQYTRYGTVLLSIIQGIGIAIGLENMAGPTGVPIVLEAGWDFRLMTILTLTAGTAFIMWLGEQITEKGIGNGISLIIFSGIVVNMPAAIFNTVRLIASGEMGIILVILLFLMMIAVVGIIVFVESGQRRIPIQYAKRVVGNKMYGGQSTHLPLKVNTAGVIPPIFASSIIMFPATIANFIPHPWMKTVADVLIPGRIGYEVLFVGFIIFFCYFYTAVTFNPIDVAENIKKYGGYVPGIRPGKKTAEYIDTVLTRLTFSGAIYVSVVCVLPSILISNFNVPFYFGGTALLIVVGVALDTAGQIETHLLTRQYEGFMKKGKIARRR